MGMFDWINFKVDCPQCGKEVTQFQSKDGRCNLENIDYYEVNNFYSSCEYCGAWIEFSRKEKCPYAPIEDYQMTTTPSGCVESQFWRDKERKIIGISGKKPEGI